MLKDYQLIYLALSPADYIVQLFYANYDDFERIFNLHDSANIMRRGAELEKIAVFFEENKDKPANPEQLGQNFLKANQQRTALFDICLETLDFGIKLAQHLGEESKFFERNRKEILELIKLIDAIELKIALEEDISKELKTFEEFDGIFDRWLTQIKQINKLIPNIDVLKNFKSQHHLVSKFLILKAWQQHRDAKLEQIEGGSERYNLLTTDKINFFNQTNISDLEVRKWCLKNPEAYKDLDHTYQELLKTIDAEEVQELPYAEIAVYKIMQLPAGLYHYQLAKQAIKIGEDFTKARWARDLPVVGRRLSETEIQVFGAISGLGYYFVEKYISGDEVLLPFGLLQSLLTCSGSLFNLIDLAHSFRCDPLDVKEYHGYLRWLSGLMVHVLLTCAFRGASMELAAGYAFAYCVATALRLALGTAFDVAADNEVGKKYPPVTRGLKWLVENRSYALGLMWSSNLYRDMLYTSDEKQTWIAQYIRDAKRDSSEMLNDTKFCFRYKAACEKTALKVLELEQDATLKEAHTAFRELSFEFHPDKGGDEKIFMEFASALNTLKVLKK